MINQIMDLTKISAGRYDLRRRRWMPAALLWLARESLRRPGRSAQGIAIDADACPVGLMVDADEAVLTGMITALMDNAVTFTQRGGRITLVGRAGEAGVAVTVEDNGAGVAAGGSGPHPGAVRACRPRRRRRPCQGRRPGPDLVKAFAELHGGALELESAPGEGFRATVILPRRPPLAPASIFVPDLRLSLQSRPARAVRH